MRQSSVGKGWSSSAALTMAIIALSYSDSPAQQYIGHYGSSAEFVEAKVNGIIISDGKQPVKVSPGQQVTGYLKVRIDRQGPASSVFPVAGVFSWDRQHITTVAGHLPPGVATVQFDFDVAAPREAGTYFIMVMAGPFMSAREVVTRDGDIWSLNRDRWMDAVNHSYFVLYPGKEQQVAKAIRITVAGGDQAAAVYSIVDLGVLPGYTSSYAVAINNSCEVVGYVEKGESRAPFVWSGGHMTLLGPAGGSYGQAEGINDAGIASGFWSSGPDPGAYMWDCSTATPVPAKLAGTKTGEARGVNKRGQIAGMPGRNSYPCLWDDGAIVNMLPPGQSTGYATDVNDSGQATGVSYKGAFIWDKGTLTFLGTLGGACSDGKAINNRAQIVGGAYDSSDRNHAFLWENGRMKDLGTLGMATSYAYDINDRGTVVGYAQDDGSSSKAFIYQNGEARILDTLIDSASGWTISVARAINDRGDIIGQGVRNGVSHAVLLQPAHAAPAAGKPAIGDQAATVYSVVDLGVLPGYTTSIGQCINNSDEAVGYLEEGGSRAPFVWSDGRMTMLGPAGGSYGQAEGINDAGIASGYWSSGPNPGAYMWDCRAPIPTATRLSGSATGEARRLNEKRQITGMSSYNLCPCLWDGDTIVNMLPPGSGGYATDVNDKGQVTGISHSGAFIWDDGTSTFLGTLGGGGSDGKAINNKGQIVGGAFDSKNCYHAFLWENGRMKDLGTLGKTTSYAHDINNHGIIVGYVRDEGSPARGFIYQNGAARILDTLIDSASGWTITEGRGINDQGVILAQGVRKGLPHAVLLRPAHAAPAAGKPAIGRRGD